MNTRRTSAGRPCRAAFVMVLTIILTTSFVSAQGWFDADWLYRSPVSVPNPGSIELTEFQVKVTLTNGVNFDFSKILAAGGSDIRITADDGITLIPFWIESWSEGVSATIWVKVPVIPTTGTTVYIYSGNANPTLPSTEPYEAPPMGPFTRAAGNPIVPSGAGSNVSLLAENIVWDPVTQHYWMVFANYSVGGVGLAWSDNPRDPTSWTWHGNVYNHGSNGSFAPHILYEDGLWYIFFSRFPDIVYITCSTINGTYSAPTIVLSPTETWETYRVDEPYVFKRNDGTWIMIYMAETGSTDEQVGYASSSSITGPYTKYSGNPCLAFGPAGSFDAGTIADPWVYEYHGTYYIGYTVSPTKNSPWSTALATTTDWLTFTKHGVILPASGTALDAQNSFRGALTRIGDEYVFSYTNGQYRMSIATQPVYVTPPNIVNNPDAVFDFYDGFNSADGSDPDPAKWTFTSGSATQTNIAGGLLTMTASGTYVRMDGLTYVGTGYVGETYARHPNRGTQNMIIETGFIQGAFTNTLRIVDDFPSITNWQRQSKTSATVGDPFVNMAQTSDINWHTFRVYRESSGSAGFQIDDNPIETVSTDVPTMGMAPFLMSYGSGNQFIIDWTRVRKWAGPADPVTAVGAGQSLARWTGTGGNGWETPGSWSTNAVPLATDDVAILDAANYPIISTAVTVNSMIIEPAASLTVSVTGSLTAARSITINTSGTGSSGSLIGHGPVTGSVTYHRFLRPQINRGERHFISSPVGGQTISGFRNQNLNLDQLWEYNEVTGGWPLVNSGSFVSGKGYNLSQTFGSLGEYSFTGSLVRTATYTATSPYATGYTDRSTALSYNENASWVDGRSWTNYGGGGWNLMGNPFTSAMNAGAFISGNPGKFDPHYQALYIYDGINDVYRYAAATVPGYPADILSHGSYVQAGQGFFVLALYDGIVFNFNSGMQDHQPAVNLLKSATVEDPWPGLRLKVRYGDKEGMTTIVYNSDMTTGIDPGFDVGQLTTSPDVEIYTTLVAKDNSVNFVRQALPVTGAENFIVPVGIDTEKGGEVTFSAYIVSSLGDSRFWLEDKTTGIFTDLTAKSYTVTLPAKTYGTGRFNIIASANTPTGIRDQRNDDASLRVWISDEKVIIRGAVSDRAICEIFDLRGQKVLQSHLTDGELNTVELASGMHGVFMVRVTDGARVTIRKVALL